MENSRLKSGKFLSPVNFGKIIEQIAFFDFFRWENFNFPHGKIHSLEKAFFRWEKSLENGFLCMETENFLKGKNQKKQSVQLFSQNRVT